MFQTVKLEKIAPHVMKLTLDRERQANALSLQLLSELKEVLAMIKKDDTIRVVLLTGSGEKAFCAGADLKERLHMNEEQVKGTVAKIRSVIHELELIRKPIVAAINGVALGGGTELCLACDIRVASEEALFSLPETSLAIIPGAGGTQRLSRLVGIGRAKDMILTARKITAQEAYEYKLIEYIVPHDELEKTALSICERIAKNGPLAIQQAKYAIQEGYGKHMDDALQVEAHAYEAIIYTNDRREGLRAFEEKRKPAYKGE
ncbi:enoyl-CoA hydratase [Priestia taiwanensis]|uniref:Enoyl-CoA hydratase n=1 Tax=Priestia taiwanensis TaxID=1347902 RepID=A0A917ELT8_9BACI|nr:enoyl-CoA hydratase [Priestia taiwanensis]MBM7362314.1 enoyl-CoA hydratase/carnithine racemase [Priestia taiwanensis]GGE61174.1 enoyl-CoA hydratase [Priestia taiwanensis]